MFKEKLNLNDRDIQIMQLVMDDPHISQSQIAVKLKLSQPSINFRLKKLREKGILTYDVGIDVSKAKLFLARVDFTAKSAQKILDGLKNCPYFVNGFVMSGKNNGSVFFISEDLKKIDEIVNNELRIHEQVSDINVNVVVNTIKNFIFHPNFKAQGKVKLCGKITPCEVCLH